MTQNQKIEPKLRFPWFSDDWKTYLLWKIWNFKNWVNKWKEDFWFWIPFVNLMDVFGKTRLNLNNLWLINCNDQEINNYSLKKWDVLFIRSSVKRIWVWKTILIENDLPKVVYSWFLIRFRSDNKIQQEYKRYCFDANSVRKQILALSTSSANTNINQESLNKVKINLPVDDEQKKISSLFNTVDIKISQLKKLKKCRENYKKWIMKKIFNQEIRFKDNNWKYYPDRKLKKLSKVLIEKVDNRWKTPPVTWSWIPLIEVNALNWKSINYQKVSKFVSKSTYESWFRQHIEFWDILFTTVWATAKCSYYQWKKTACIAQNIVGLRFKRDTSEFMYYMLTYKPNNNKLKSIEMIAVQPSIKVSQMVKLQFEMPTEDEMIEIWKFLSWIDKKIEKMEKQIILSQERKKGLLQQMFV